MLYYGNFESVSKKEALTLCSGLTEGDYVIIDERVFRSDDCVNMNKIELILDRDDD